MKKNHCSMVSMLLRVWKCKMLLVMRLTLLICLFFAFQSIAIEALSQNQRLSINQKSMKIEEIIQLIENKTDYYFMYSAQTIDVERTVDIEATDKLVPEILADIFKGTNVSYKIDGRLIALSENGEISPVSQQQKSISGKVTDSSGGSLPGVSVVVKGTTTGTITDANGNYSLSNVPANATLQFSFVGMKSQEVKAGIQASINVILVDETIGIEEVVAIGYGTMKKSDLTGAIGAVKGQTLANRKVTQLSQSLQGSIPGLTVTRGNNTPGSSASILIRGITTIGDSNPLVIVDGVPALSIDDINPNDVESISVLKDAASASIYGSRAASGVILVTTKRAESGKAEFNYNFEYGFEKPSELPEYVNAVRYMEMSNELTWNNNNNNSNQYPTFSKDVIENYANLHAQNPDLYPNTDWQSIVLNDFAPRQSHLFNFNVGSKNIRTSGSFNYEKADALYDYRSYERYTSRINNDININNYLSANIDISFKHTVNKLPSVYPLEDARMLPAIYAAEWSDGRIASGKSGQNAYGLLKYGGFNNSWGNQLGAKASIDFKPFKGLKITGVLSPTLLYDKGKQFYKKVPYYSWNDASVLEGYLRNTTSLTESRNDGFRITKQLLVNYIAKINESHDLNIMAGYEDYYSKSENLGASRDQYELNNYPFLDLGNGTYQYNTGNASENAYRSYFGRILYNFKNKYYVQSNIRYDGSSRFAKDYRWGSFPSFSLGWVVSEESFLKDFTAISFLKLRGSWGRLGNERIGNYPYQSTIGFGNTLFYNGATITSANTAAQIKYAINNISWETTESWDIGFDANLVDNKLQFSGDYYKKTTKKMLLALEIPDYIGYANPDQNSGKMYTKGWEFQIGWNDQIGKFKYSASFNLADFKSIMGDLGGTEFIGTKVKKKGSEYNEWYGYLSDGLFQTQEQLNSSAKTSSSVGLGDVKYKDISGPDGVPDGKITPDYDRVLLGGSLPRLQFGGTLNINYGNFNLSLVIQGVGKQNVILDSYMIEPLKGSWVNIPKIVDGNYWSKHNTDEQNLKALYPRLSSISEGNNYAPSDYWMINGAYLRMKNITLGYNLPKHEVQKLRLQEIRIYASGNDLFSINNYPKGWDPEVTDFRYYPITSSIILGISLKF